MKTTVFTSFLIMFVFVLNAQVSLNYTYNYSANVVKFETFGYKYYIMDVPNAQCRIYNTDHSLFRTINCGIPNGFYLYDIKYISEKLFDTDSGIELLCTFYKNNSSPDYYEYDSKIINEDGSQIQFIDGALYNYINKTEQNTNKLFSYCYNFSIDPEKVWTNIYNLPENPVYGEEEIFICSGSDYLGWAEPGDYQRTVVLANGGDSIVTTHLFVLPTLESYEQIFICEGENYLDWTESGNYNRTLIAVSGCDSTIFTELIVWDSLYSDEEISICQGGNYLDWTEPGDFQRTVVSVNGCDSIVTTHLSVLSPIETIQDITICEGETYKGLDSEGQYSETFESSLGCDSIVILNLSFYSLPQPEIIIRGDTLRSNIIFQNYQWFNEEGELAGANQPELIIQASGEYFLKVADTNGCTAFSAPVDIIFSSVNSVGLNEFKYTIIPNPSSGKFSFRIDSNPSEEIQLKLLNNLGQVVETRLINETLTNYNEQFDVSRLGKGIYYLHIELNNTIKTEKVITK